MLSTHLRRRITILMVVAMAMSMAVIPSGLAEERETVVIWHLWSGNMEEQLMKVVDAFNAENEKYVIECLSVPDVQKIVVAISSGDGPDITDYFSSGIAEYASMGILEPLNSYIEASGYDLSDFIPAATQSCTYDGVLYAIPCNVNLLVLYYNKDLLAEAGYDAPPETIEQMLEMAINTTKLNDDGTIKTMGFPVFPADNYANTVAAACGGGWVSADGLTPTPVSEGNLQMLEMYVAFKEKFGHDAVSLFQSSGKTNDPSDPFLRGDMVFRIDGTWMSGYFDKFDLDVNYGVTYIPYPEGKEALKGRQFIQSSMFYIASNAKNKEGAWEAMMYINSEMGQLTHIIGGNNFPSRMSLLDTSEYTELFPHAEFFAEYAMNENLIALPNSEFSAKYNTLVSEQLELAFNLKQTPEQTLQNIEEQAASIFTK